MELVACSTTTGETNELKLRMSIGIFDTAYLPSVEYMKCLSSCEAFFIDGTRMWQKQTVRNRAFILSPNGIQTLTVPIEHTGGKKVPVSDIRISYAMDWVRQHLGALDSAYNRSAYYEFFRDDMYAAFRSKPEYLLELNNTLLDLFNKKLNKVPRLQVLLENAVDYRTLSNVDNADPVVLSAENFTSYTQVFSDRFEFKRNLSVLDLLAATGKMQ